MVLQLRSVKRQPFPELVPYRIKKTTKTVSVFDSETDKFENGAEIKPFTCGLYDGAGYYDFWGDDCIQQFANHMHNRRHQRLLIYAHNFGGFDVHMMKEGLDTQSNPLIINGRICKAQLFGQEFRDSYKIIPVPLREMQKEEFDYNKNDRDKREKYKDEILSYQYSDCLNLHKPIMAFHDMFGDRITIGNCAINMLMSYHQFERLSERQDDAIRPFFYGGRTQYFERGVLRGNWIVVDVNSMYPFVMANYRHPISNSLTTTKYITENTAFVECEGWNSNAFPTRGDHGELDFTVKYGKFKVTIHEYNMAMKLGLFKLRRIIRCINFTTWADFSTYINTFYDLRMQAKRDGDPLLVLFYKLLMNNAYGKFAQDGRKYKDYLILDHGILPPEGLWHETENPYGWRPAWEHDYGVIWQRKSIRPPKYFNVATGASITGAARAELMQGIARGKRVAYCDTDSLICEGFTGDQDPTRLGAWKLEAEGTNLAIAGKKMYALKDGNTVIKKASKGVGLTAEEIFQVASGDEIIYKPMVPTFSLDGSVTYNNRLVRMT